MSQFSFDGATVLELFSCYESILPPAKTLGPVVGVGWFNDEMKCNPDLDDFIEQDISVDPFLALADNYFDFVIIPSMFQLFQRPLDMFREINRVLKPGGVAIVGVKL
jgi:SAM-dependent methyltransferase